MGLNSVYKLTLIGRTPSQGQLINNLYYQAEGVTILDKQTDDLIEAFLLTGSGNVLAKYLACFANTVGFDRLEAREVTDPALEFGEANVTLTGTGGSGDVLPPQCSAVVSWRTGNIGRSFRGRSYIWPTLESNQNGGQWAGGYVTTLEAFAAAAQEIGDGISTAFYQLGVWSKFSNGQPRLEPVFTPVTTSHIPIFVHTQRRRVTGVGS
jgi:hypothetical protein